MSTRSFLDAGFPLLFIATHDESRIEAELADSGRKLFHYSAAGSLVDRQTQSATLATFAAAFAAVSAEPNAVLIVRDMQHVIRNAPIYRALIDAAEPCKLNGSAIVAVAPAWQLPAELQHVAPVVSQALPSREELGAPLDGIIEAAGIDNVDAFTRSELLDAAAGLTLAEAENSFALSLVERGELSPAIVQREKMRLVASTGFLSVEQSASIDSIGGLGSLKSYLIDEVLPVVSDGQLAVRGILLAGPPGTGKSLAAKACGAALRRPVVRLDIGACKGSLVGQSEANLRQATALVEAIAPCVLWIDELEKAIGGASGGGSSDGGTSLGMLGHILTWLQEHKAAVFTIATVNNYQSLPPELTRAGRFDERFCVDLPTSSERRAIAAVHLARFGCDVELAELVAERTPNYTGAEIEQLVKSSARLSGRRIDAEHVDAAAATIRPIASVAKDQIDAFRAWSRRALRLANTPESVSTAGRVAGHRATLAALN